MKNKGFTLIELLVTIGLIAIVTTIIVVNTSGLQTKETSVEATKFQDRITSAGCSFIDAEVNNISRVKCKNGATCQVPLSLLVSEGLIDENEIDPATNKKVSDELDSVYVEVTWETKDGYKEKTCKYKEGKIADDLPTNTTANPICRNPEVPTTVQIDPVTITYGCDSSSVDGCMSKDETKTYDKTTNETITWTVEDYYNLKTNCSYNVNVTIDTTEPTITAKSNPLSLGNVDYDFTSNVTATFGPAGGKVTCDPAVSKKTGSYEVTCTATPNNRKSAVTTKFSVRHSYPATYNSEIRYGTRNVNCGNRGYDCRCHQEDDCGYCSGGWCCQNCGGHCCGYCCNGYYCQKKTVCDTCTHYVCDQETYSYVYSYYTCPNGGTLSGSTCNY